MDRLMSRLRPLALLPALALPGAAGARAEPQSRPPEQAQAQSQAQAPAPGQTGGTAGPQAPAAMRQWFDELDHADAAVREAARVKLMGMRREDLPAFRRLVRDNMPLMPSQAAVIRSVVTHVFLTGEKYDTTEVEGFLGVKMQETSVRLPAADGADQFAPAVGVVIVERMPGFAGARMLLDGDVVLGIVERPDVRALGTYEFTMVVKAVTPGTTIHFQVMRQGQVIRVPIAPDPRPFEADGTMNDLLYRRQYKADAYWDQEFAPVMKESVG